MNALERRYRSLLRAYPASYRADRDGEMLDTLLEASRPGQSWPAARDVRALLMGGLRARTGLTHRGSLAASLRQVVLFAAVLDLVEWSATEWHWGSEALWTGRPQFGSWFDLALAILILTAAASAWLWRRPVVVALAVVTAALMVVADTGKVAFQPIGANWLVAIEPFLALAVIPTWARKWERLPRSWLGLAALQVAFLLLPVFLQPTSLVGANVVTFVEFGLAGIALVWSPVDARPLAAVALWITTAFGAYATEQLFTSGVSAYLWSVSLPAIIALIVAAMGTWLMRRQAAL